MKFTITFKTPDALDNVLSERSNREIQEDEEDTYEEDCEDIRDVAEKFMKYGESITVEFDTELGSATVLKA